MPEDPRFVSDCLLELAGALNKLLASRRQQLTEVEQKRTELLETVGRLQRSLWGCEHCLRQLTPGP